MAISSNYPASQINTQQTTVSSQNVPSHKGFAQNIEFVKTEGGAERSQQSQDHLPSATSSTSTVEKPNYYLDPDKSDQPFLQSVANDLNEKNITPETVPERYSAYCANFNLKYQDGMWVLKPILDYINRDTKKAIDSKVLDGSGVNNNVKDEKSFCWNFFSELLHPEFGRCDEHDLCWKKVNESLDHETNPAVQLVKAGVPLGKVISLCGLLNTKTQKKLSLALVSEGSVAYLQVFHGANSDTVAKQHGIEEYPKAVKLLHEAAFKKGSVMATDVFNGANIRDTLDKYGLPFDYEYSNLLEQHAVEEGSAAWLKVFKGENCFKVALAHGINPKGNFFDDLTEAAAEMGSEAIIKVESGGDPVKVANEQGILIFENRYEPEFSFSFLTLLCHTFKVDMKQVRNDPRTIELLNELSNK